MINAFRKEMWYCAHCALHPDHSQPFSGLAAVTRHLQDKHGKDPLECQSLFDYVQGFTANQQWARRCKEAVEEGERAAKFLKQEDYNVADFLVDAGVVKEDAA